MRKLLLLFTISLLLYYSCDDGDVIEFNLDFSGVLSKCESSDSYVIYDIKSDPYESITLVFPIAGNEHIFRPTEETTGTLTINGSSIKFNYRKYDGDPENSLICVEIPSTDVTILDDKPANSGTVNYTITFEDIDGTRHFEVVFTIEELDLEILNSTFQEIGTYTDSYEL